MSCISAFLGVWEQVLSPSIETNPFLRRLFTGRKKSHRANFLAALYPLSAHVSNVYSTHTVVIIIVVAVVANCRFNKPKYNLIEIENRIQAKATANYKRQSALNVVLTCKLATGGPMRKKIYMKVLEKYKEI